MGQGKTLNLFSHRAPQSVWDRRGWHGVTLEERVGPWLVSMAGAGLLVYGATRRRWGGLWYMLSGVGLIGCMASGFCNSRDAGLTWRHRVGRHSAPDAVTTESMDSFLASDAPSSNATIV
jgi:hypothetical protein